mmetsp:Transcript_135395/g.306344  ORF Transcript_135395/g.306344 Transcript_135395/m.306344 type:complete len:234 (+) Transcript_135395:316-1017(+)
MHRPTPFDCLHLWRWHPPWPPATAPPPAASRSSQLHRARLSLAWTLPLAMRQYSAPPRPPTPPPALFACVPPVPPVPRPPAAAVRPPRCWWKRLASRASNPLVNPPAAHLAQRQPHAEHGPPLPPRQHGPRGRQARFQLVLAPRLHECQGRPALVKRRYPQGASIHCHARCGPRWPLGVSCKIHPAAKPAIMAHRGPGPASWRSDLARLPRELLAPPRSPRPTSLKQSQQRQQ